ncbi:MAG: hypothetical protein HC815_09450 [Richelia sp. RM1_1_1]|nr:hypothetical protein [Richelia sp. SM1_7_0]NJN08200.1 hypothetical protein [Richelia sp. RM1_1_1]
MSRPVFKSITTVKLIFRKVVRSRHTSQLASGSCLERWGVFEIGGICENKNSDFLEKWTTRG